MYVYIYSLIYQIAKEQLNLILNSLNSFPVILCMVKYIN